MSASTATWLCPRGSANSVDGGLDIDIPTSYRIDIPTDFSIRVRELAPIEIKPIEIRPLDLSIRLKEISSVRAHLPLNYKVGLALLGREVACVSLCGQGQFITEPYVPYPCEPKPQRPERPEPPDPKPVG